MGLTSRAATVRLFDAHCHLQDLRIFAVAPQLIRTSVEAGIHHFAVNGVSEKDWHLVKQLADDYASVIPCFGLHPWFVGERSPNWFKSIREFFEATPTAAVGEIGLDKGSHGKGVDFTIQVEVFQQLLSYARQLDRPASVHCVRAHGELLDIMQREGPFPAGVILHSYLGSADMVPEFAKLGSYFSFSGHNTFLKPEKAKKILKSVPVDRILLESDAPDGLPKSNMNSLLFVPGDPFVPQEQNETSCSSDLPKETLNHPANIRSVLNNVAGLLEIDEEELAEISYRNAAKVFSYPGSKIVTEC